MELLSGVTHEDCATFAQDFGTVLDVEDLIPGAEYTLEVSSPGLERKLNKAEDYLRFQGSLVKLQTFTPVDEEPALAGPIGEVCGWSFDAGSFGREAEGQGEEGSSGADS